jgi:hypothetical protein
MLSKASASGSMGSSAPSNKVQEPNTEFEVNSSDTADDLPF